MFENGPNPTKVQLCPPYKRSTSTPPLVLLHDGGGTTFSYFILGKLHRDVWALHNPKYWDSGKWEGGMDEMSRHYVDLIKKAGISGTIFLGGWSLGGYLSLAIARLLADDPASNIKVAGMLIIDSPYHVPRSEIRGKTVEPELSSLPQLVQNCFDNCDEMLESWQLPAWDAPTNKGKPARIAVSGRSFTVEPGKIIHKPVKGDWTTKEVQKYEFKETPAGEAKAPPPAVMIRCTLPAEKAKDAKDSTDPCIIDLFRDEPLLGWEGKYPDYIVATIDVEANHYGVFDKFDHGKTKIITDHLISGLEILDSIREPSKAAALDYF